MKSASQIFNKFSINNFGANVRYSALKKNPIIDQFIQKTHMNDQIENLSKLNNRTSRSFSTNTDREIKQLNLYNSLLLEETAGDTSHIPMIDSPNSEQNRGKLFMRVKEDHQEKPVVIECKEDYVPNIICFGGQGFDTEAHHGALISSVEKLFGVNNPNDLYLQNIRPAAYQSNYDNKTRYEEMMKYSLNHKPEHSKYYIEEMKDWNYSYFSADIEKFCLDVLMPIFDKMEKNDSLVLYSYSGGGREIMMIQNALTGILRKELNVSFEKIANFFESIRSVSQAFANVMTQENKPEFSKRIFHATDDTGVKISKKFAKAFYADNTYDICTCYPMYNLLNNNIASVVFIYGKDSEKIDHKRYKTGHELRYYTDLAMKALSEEDLQNLKKFLNPSFIEPEQEKSKSLCR